MVAKKKHAFNFCIWNDLMWWVISSKRVCLRVKMHPLSIYARKPIKNFSALVYQMFVHQFQEMRSALWLVKTLQQNSMPRVRRLTEALSHQEWPQGAWSVRSQGTHRAQYHSSTDCALLKTSIALPSPQEDVPQDCARTSSSFAGRRSAHGRQPISAQEEPKRRSELFCTNYCL